MSMMSKIGARLAWRKSVLSTTGGNPCGLFAQYPAEMRKSSGFVVSAGTDAKQTGRISQKQQTKKRDSSSGGITAREEDFSRWYLDVVKEAQLADYGPVRGTMVIRPSGYSLWESIQSHLDTEFKKLGVQNAYFPQLIPLAFLQKEAEHVEGFGPELALVTQGGGKELDEPLVVRPTSETIVNHMFGQWIQSYRDLPLLINQWCNVHRWEMRTRPFIRNLEFLWQEGHTAHATKEEAEEQTVKMLRLYESFAKDIAAMPVIAGRKSKRESFAGANCTYTIEAMMQDKRALQAGTSHNLGDNFARAFKTQYLDEDGERNFVHQSSWGVSTRLIGGIIMTHGDDNGLRLPPKMAPTQIVVIPIVKKGMDISSVLDAAKSIHLTLSSAGYRSHLDDSLDRTPGWKFNNYELKGVPVRIEIGPKDLESNSCVVARRDIVGKEGKTFGVSLESDSLVQHVATLLDDIQESLLQSATAFRNENIVDISSYDELISVIETGKWARGYWCGSDEDELRVKEETSATLRCYPFEQPSDGGICFMTGQNTKEVAIFAKAY